MITSNIIRKRLNSNLLSQQLSNYWRLRSPFLLLKFFFWAKYKTIWRPYAYIIPLIFLSSMEDDDAGVSMTTGPV